MTVDAQSPQEEPNDQPAEEVLVTKSYQEQQLDKQWEEFLHKDDEEEVVPEEDDNDNPSEPEPAEEPDAIPDVIMQRAQALGFTADDIRGLTPSRAQALFDQWDRQAAEFDAQAQKEQTEEVKSEESPEFTFEPFKLDNPDDYDDVTIKMVDAFNSRMEAMHKQISEMSQVKSAFDQMTQQQQSQAIKAETEWLDSQFAKHASDLGHVIGTGSIGDLTREQFEARNKVYHTALALRKVDTKLAPEEAFERALFANFQQVLNEKAREQERGNSVRQSKKRVGATTANRGTNKVDWKSLPPDHPAYIEGWKNEWQTA